MYNQNNEQRMVVIFDGIDNSVFKSQVLRPLLKEIETNKNLEVTLVSFEKKAYAPETLTAIIPPHDQLHVIICPRTPFLGSIGLHLSKYYFQKAIDEIPLETIIARGPLAGWLVLHHIQDLYKSNRLADPINITIQARGIAAEEYRLAYEHKALSWYHEIIHTWYYYALESIERTVYAENKFKKKYQAITIEAVSPALKEYLIAQYNAEESRIIIATQDLIPPLSIEEKQTWREKIRLDLQIPSDAPVYCYSGSLKPWQCIVETIKYMNTKAHEAPQTWFLFFVPEGDRPLLQTLIKKHFTAQNEQIIIRSIVPSHLLRYLAAADYGLLLRSEDIVNWTSRPTKALEYQAAGVNIIHNNTVAYLKQK